MVMQEAQLNELVEKTEELCWAFQISPLEINFSFVAVVVTVALITTGNYTIDVFL